MIIEERFGNDYYGNVIIQNYPNLQLIVVKKNSLKNLNSLKICNCEKLKTIEIGYAIENNAMDIDLDVIDIDMFLIYNHSKQEINHSIKQQVYLYQVILSNSTLIYIFLIYNHS